MKYFLIYLFLEVLVSVKISSAIGGLNTFFEIIFSAFLGVYILANFKSTLVENLQAVANRSIDLAEFQKLNLFSLIGAILLIIPGFMTDILGVLLQFGVITTMFVNRFGVKSDSCNTSFEEENLYKKDSDVIDVEIIEHNSSIKH